MCSITCIISRLKLQGTSQSMEMNRNQSLDSSYLEHFKIRSNHGKMGKSYRWTLSNNFGMRTLVMLCTMLPETFGYDWRKMSNYLPFIILFIGVTRIERFQENVKFVLFVDPIPMALAPSNLMWWLQGCQPISSIVRASTKGTWYEQEHFTNPTVQSGCFP